MLFASRLVAGLGMGCGILLAPIYIAEIGAGGKSHSSCINNTYLTTHTTMQLHSSCINNTYLTTARFTDNAHHNAITF